jgi:uncharacterized protein YjiS (DUF1127 family)
MSIVNLFTSAARSIAKRRLRERAFAELMALDDHSLADIGVHRSQIRALVEGGPAAGGAAAAPMKDESGYWSAHARLIGSPG